MTQLTLISGSLHLVSLVGSYSLVSDDKTPPETPSSGSGTRPELLKSKFQFVQVLSKQCIFKFSQLCGDFELNAMS